MCKIVLWKLVLKKKYWWNRRDFEFAVKSKCNSCNQNLKLSSKNVNRFKNEYKIMYIFMNIMTLNCLYTLYTEGDYISEGFDNYNYKINPMYQHQRSLSDIHTECS